MGARPPHTRNAAPHAKHDSLFERFQRFIQVPMLQCSMQLASCLFVGMLTYAKELFGIDFSERADAATTSASLAKAAALGAVTAYYLGFFCLYTAPRVLDCAYARLRNWHKNLVLEEQERRHEAELELKLEALQQGADQLQEQEAQQAQARVAAIEATLATARQEHAQSIADVRAHHKATSRIGSDLKARWLVAEQQG